MRFEYHSMSLNLPISPLQLIPDHPGKDRGISLFIKRDDLLHPDIQGSKARKLAAILPGIKQSHPGGIVTFGGAFSNHLHAVATAGKVFNIRTVGIVRGEDIDIQNATLRVVSELGMTLIPMPKTRYDAIKEQAEIFMGDEFSQCYFLPEGGSTAEAVMACAAIPVEILAQLQHDHPELDFKPLYICAPAGTGCTAAGVVAGLNASSSQVLIFPVSSHDFEESTILRFLSDTHRSGDGVANKFKIVYEYTFGGFAKLHPPVMAFVRSFYQETNILLDPVYTAKMLFGIYQMLDQGAFQPGSTVVMLHTGGIQGWKGFRERYGMAGMV